MPAVTFASPNAVLHVLARASPDAEPYFNALNESLTKHEKELRMENHIYKHTDLTGTSATGIEEAITNAVARAAKTVRNMRWFEVIDTRGHIEEGKVTQWQVTVRVGFTLED